MNSHYQTIILGGGLSGLTVAYKLSLNRPNHKFLVLEKSNRTGGVIRSHEEQGFISEIGPHGFLDNCQESKQILVETGLDGECVKAPLIDFVRYVFFNNKLNLIPQTPGKILKAPLIPWSAKLRVLLELFQPALAGEPTVAKWVHHRFGPALLPYLDAVYTGTYAGDFDKLTIDSVMPGVRAIEKEYGSVLYGLFSEMKKKKKSRPKGENRSLQMPAMTSFPKGMVRLPERLSENLHLGKNLLLDTIVLSVKPQEKFWHIATTEGSFSAENVIFALPINESLKMLSKIDGEIPEKTVPETWLSTVVFGFTESTQLPPGFGYLTPECEKRFTLGSLFSSNMFPNRAPDGHIVFETLIGGRRHPERVFLDNSELSRRAFDDVKEILNINAHPVYTTVLRSGGGIPQLERNYPALLKWREEFKKKQRGVQICGFGWDGIGLNDMMKHATKVADAILSGPAGGRNEPEVKGVYF